VGKSWEKWLENPGSWDEKPTDMEIDPQENCMGITYGNIAEYHPINSINPWDC